MSCPTTEVINRSLLVSYPLSIVYVQARRASRQNSGVTEPSRFDPKRSGNL